MTGSVPVPTRYATILIIILYRVGTSTDPEICTVTSKPQTVQVWKCGLPVITPEHRGREQTIVSRLPVPAPAVQRGGAGDARRSS